MEAKFKVGDLVVHKGSLEVWRAEAEAFSRLQGGKQVGVPIVMIVLETHRDECPGGIQYHYSVREWSFQKGIAVNATRLNEIELESYDDKEVIDGLYRAIVGKQEK